MEFPGDYTVNANTSLSEFYNLIGDFKEEAYLDGIIFLREAIREKQLAAIEKSKEDLNRAILASRQKVRTST